MLKGISALISPELLKILSEMGHGDELVLGDAHFPSENYGKRCIRADGIGAAALLKAILPLFPLDKYVDEPVALMSVAPGDDADDPAIWNEYKQIIDLHAPNIGISYLERFAFYDRAREAYAVVATGEKAIYANIIIKKGVVTE